MPNYKVWQETSNGRWFHFMVNAKSVAEAREKSVRLLRDVGHKDFEGLEFEVAEHQRKQRKFPALVSLAPQKMYAWKRARIARTNQEGTCLWCGKKLVRTRDEGLGGYADNAFCSMRCGYEFGITAAALGYRLKERSDAG